MERLEPASAGFVQKTYRFGGFRLHADGSLFHGEIHVALSLKELVALRLLLANPGRVITPAEFKHALWGSAPVPADSVSKCLASLRKKLEPEECIETVDRHGYRLAVLGPPAEAAAPLPRLAILPLVAEYGVPEHLGAAVADEASARIAASQPAAVSLAARDSISALARRGLPPVQIGQMVNADLVLSGTLRALPSHYRLRIELIHTADGAQAWIEDLFVERGRAGRLEAELVHFIHLRMESGAGLSIHASAALPEADQTPDLTHGQTPGQTHGLTPDQILRRHDAYALLLRGRYEWQTLERHRMQDALQHLLRAIDLDPTLAPAQVELSHLCITLSFYGFMPPAIAADVVRKTVTAPDEVPFGAEGILPALGWISFHLDRNLRAALSLYRRAGHLPYNSWIARAETLLAVSRHRFGEAIELLQSAMHNDPWSPWPRARLAWVHHLAGDPAASLRQAHAALEHFPNHEGTQIYGATILAFNGEAQAAVELSQQLARRLPYLDLATPVHAYALAMAGQRDEARSMLERLEWLSRERYVLKTFSPAVYVALGEPEKALADLRASEQARCPWFFQMLADPRLKPLHSHAEFQSMLGILSAMEAEAQRNQPEP